MKSLICLVWLALVPTLFLAQEQGFFRPNDRVLFLGDSITEQYQYSSYIELYLTTRFPNYDLKFINAGISGDTATGGASRFQNHVLAEKSTVLLINFGMNDGGYGGFDQKRQDGYVRNTEKMVVEAKAAGVRVALISPNAVEVRCKPNLATYLETQKQFYAPLQGIAEKHKVLFVDQYSVTRGILEKLASDNAEVKPFPDAVHTNEAGGLLMAHTILTGLKVPSVVSAVEITAGKSEPETKHHCHITDLKSTASQVSFKRLDAALPMPILASWKPLLPYLNQLNDLNAMTLKVQKLSPGKYALKIDGSTMGEFTDVELSKGINIGNMSTGAYYEQAMKVYQAMQEKNSHLHRRFRDVKMFNVPEWLKKRGGEALAQEELESRWKEIDKKQAEIHKLAQPREHGWELTKVNP